MKIKQLIPALMLLTLPTNTFCEITARDLYVAAVTAVAASLATVTSTVYYLESHHPAALEREKLRIEQEAVKKKEAVELAAKQKAENLANQEQHTRHQLLKVMHTYQQELEALRAGSLKKKIAEIIKAKHNDNRMPLSVYHAKLMNDLQTLQANEHYAPEAITADYHNIIDRLHDILHQYNLLHGQDLQAEQTAAEQKRKTDEADQRKVEKEQLEIQKLRTEIENQKHLDHVLSRVEDLEHKILFHARANTDQCNTISQILSKQGQEITTLKETMKSNNDFVKANHALIINMLEKIIKKKKEDKNPGPQPRYPAPPAYNPQANGHMPAPSAPPM